MVLLINVLVFSMKIHLFDIRIAILRAYDTEYPPYREKYRLLLCDRLLLCWSSFRFAGPAGPAGPIALDSQIRNAKESSFCQKFDVFKTAILRACIFESCWSIPTNPYRSKEVHRNSMILDKRRVSLTTISAGISFGHQSQRLVPNRRR